MEDETDFRMVTDVSTVADLKKKLETIPDNWKIRADRGRIKCSNNKDAYACIYFYPECKEENYGD